MWHFVSDLKSIWPESYFTRGPVSKPPGVRFQIYHEFTSCIETIFYQRALCFTSAHTRARCLVYTTCNWWMPEGIMIGRWEFCANRGLFVPQTFSSSWTGLFESGNGWTRPALLVSGNWEIISAWHVGLISLGEKRSAFAFLMCLVGFPGTAQMTKLSVTGLGPHR